MQQDLFNSGVQAADPPLPIDGLRYRQEFIGAEEEAILIERIAALPLTNARYRQYTARRRTLNFGAGYDFAQLTTTRAPPMPEFLCEVRQRAAHWAGVQCGDLVQALVAEYRPGTALGWHRDVPDYQLVIGISLAGAARIRFRPYPWSPSLRLQTQVVTLQPRSVYLLGGAARWQWQHCVPPVKTLRYSITFRTRRSQPGPDDRGSWTER